MSPLSTHLHAVCSQPKLTPSSDFWKATGSLLQCRLGTIVKVVDICVGWVGEYVIFTTGEEKLQSPKNEWLKQILRMFTFLGADRQRCWRARVRITHTPQANIRNVHVAYVYLGRPFESTAYKYCPLCSKNNTTFKFILINFLML